MRRLVKKFRRKNAVMWNNASKNQSSDVGTDIWTNAKMYVDRVLICIYLCTKINNMIHFPNSFFRQTTKFVSQNARNDVVLFRNLLRGRIVNTFAKFANPGIVGKSSLRFLSKNVIGRNKSPFVRPSTKRIAKRFLKKNVLRDKTRNVWTCHRRNANPWHEKDAIKNPCRYTFQESLFWFHVKITFCPFFEGMPHGGCSRLFAKRNCGW